MKITVRELKSIIGEAVHAVQLVEKKRFGQWMRRVQAITKRQLGLNIADIPNVDLNAAFAAGMTPLQTFEDVLFPAQGGFRFNVHSPGFMR